MDIFEKVKLHKNSKEVAKSTQKDIIQFISEKFVNVRYKTEIFDVGYPRGYDKKEIKVYYPILDIPEDFSKESDEFFREGANTIIHEISYVDEKNRKIILKEKGIIEKGISKIGEDAVEIHLTFGDYMVSKVYYNFIIDEEEYNIDRTFSYEEMLKEILENQVAVYDNSDEIRYEAAEKAYEEHLKSLGTKEVDIIPLKQIVAEGIKEKEITPLFTAIFKISRKYLNVTYPHWYNQFFILKVKENQDIVEIEVEIVTTAKRVSLSKKCFKYGELCNKEKYQNEMTLHEIFKLLTE